MQMKTKIIVIAVVGVLLLSAVLFLLSHRRSVQQVVSPAPSVTQSPSLSPFVGKTYTDPVKHISLTYPSDWQQASVVNPDDPTVRFVFTADGTQHIFQIAPPSSGGVQGLLVPVDKVVDTDAVYGGQQFTKRVWYSQGKPIMIAALPKNPGDTSVFFQMSIPTTNTDSYIRLFDQIMASLRPE